MLGVLKGSSSGPRVSWFINEQKCSALSQKAQQHPILKNLFIQGVQDVLHLRCPTIQCVANSGGNERSLTEDRGQKGLNAGAGGHKQHMDRRASPKEAHETFLFSTKPLLPRSRCSKKPEPKHTAVKRLQPGMARGGGRP